MFEIQEVEPASDNPLKKWRAKVEANSLSQLDFVTFLQSSAAQFIHIEQKSNSELGKFCVAKQSKIMHSS